MNRSPRRNSALFGGGVIAALALVAVIAANVGAAGNPPASPSTPPASPSTPPASTPPVSTPEPTPVFTPAPTPVAPGDGTFNVDLDIAADDDVSIVVKDESDKVKGVTSGHAGDGMSVRWGDAKLENVDADTLRLTWVGLPGDAELQGLVKEYDNGLTIFVIQAEPPANSDALGSDRVLLLDFSEPIRAQDIRVVVQEGLDTAS